MKTKIFRKKMVLNKRTIANLNNHEMKDVYGGIDYTHRTNCECNTLRSCWTDATCCGPCETESCTIVIIPLSEQTCDTEQEC